MSEILCWKPRSRVLYAPLKYVREVGVVRPFDGFVCRLVALLRRKEHATRTIAQLLLLQLKLAL